MAKLDDNQLIGITETGDPCFHLEIFDNLKLANIIVTKRLTDKLIEKLVEHSDKCILHLSITGMGGSKVEPLVPTMHDMYNKFNLLTEKGFPVEQVVLRIDPIVPTSKGIETAIKVIRLFRDSGIKRMRWSSLDMYPHVIERFKENKIPLPYETFHATTLKRRALDSLLEAACYVADMSIESCGEPDIESIPCISQKDIDILGLNGVITLEGNAEQRSNCHCPANKYQLIKDAPKRCNNGCIYCFWKEKK